MNNKEGGDNLSPPFFLLFDNYFLGLTILFKDVYTFLQLGFLFTILLSFNSSIYPEIHRITVQRCITSSSKVSLLMALFLVTERQL